MLQFALVAVLPPDPPKGFSADAFDKLIANIAGKVGVTVPPTTKIVTPWRWTAGISPFDGAAKSLRDNLESLVKGVNEFKNDFDSYRTGTNAKLADHETRLDAVEASQRPFLSGVG